jgi:ABC-2 type transport system permease protein
MNSTLYKFIAGIRKESLVLVRDLPGLAILFLMPLLLVLVVTLAQMTALKDQSPATEILFLNTTHSPFSDSLASDLTSSGLFRLVTTYQGRKLDTGLVYRLIGKGSFPFAILTGLNDDSVTIVSDPALNTSYRNPIQSSLKFMIKATSLRIRMVQMMDAYRSHMDSITHAAVSAALERQRNAIEAGMNRKFRKMSGNDNLPWIKLDRDYTRDEKPRSTGPEASAEGPSGSDTRSALSAGELIPVQIREVAAIQEASNITPTPVQNNVPGFILFAMFFIVIPLSASIISEKNEGSHQRLVTLPVTWLMTLSSKASVYLIVCLIQFLLMMFMGTWFFPAAFGFPPLEIGTHYGLILLVTLAAGLAAVGFGILVGTFATNFGQASLFGSVMVVILGLLSGTFLPIQVMPGVIRMISLVSPVRWGIDAYLALFVRNGGMLQVLPYILLLLMFFGLAMMISVFIFARRKEVS